jgi:tetratricopeptide (TPR) repeat protein
MAKKNNIGRRPSGTPNTGRTSGNAGGTLGQEGDDTLVDIVEVRDQGLDFFEKNRNIILGVVFAIAALVVAYFVYQTLVVKPAEDDAATYMQQAQVEFERDSFNRALVNPNPAILGFVDIADQYSATPSGNLANYYAAVSYLNVGRHEAAISYMNDFDAGGTMLAAMKYGVIGDAESELEKLDGAAASYQKAITAAGDNFVTGGYYLSKLAQLYNHQGKKAEALEAFKRLKKEYGQSPEAANADKYIKMLEM